MSRLLLLAAVLALSLSLVSGDVYLHHPRGSNDRVGPTLAQPQWPLHSRAATAGWHALTILCMLMCAYS